MDRSDASADLRAVRVAALLAILLSGCDSDGARSTPTAPNVPTSPPPPISTLPVSEAATPGTYERTTPHSGSLESRFVFAGDGTFSLEYGSNSSSQFAYAGSYAREGDWYVLDFDDWSTPGSWPAVASFSGACVEVEFSLLMQLTDFEDGRFCR